MVRVSSERERIRDWCWEDSKTGKKDPLTELWWEYLWIPNSVQTQMKLGSNVTEIIKLDIEFVELVIEMKLVDWSEMKWNKKFEMKWMPRWLIEMRLVVECKSQLVVNWMS